MRIFFAILLLTGGGFFTFVGASNLKNAIASSKWPSVQGRVVESGIDESRRKSTNQKSQLRKTRYKPHVTYSYTIEGRSFTGNNLIYGLAPTSKRSEAEEMLVPFPAGKTVPVYYKPENKAVSVLQPGVNLMAVMLPASGVLMMGFGIILALKMRRPL